MDRKIENILKNLEFQGWVVQENFLSIKLVKELRRTLDDLYEKGALKKAAIGRGKSVHTESTIRRDEICWFHNHELNKSQEKLIQITEKLRLEINQKFYLGLFELEVHFSLYLPNTFYKRHLDQHKNQDARVLSIIIYLNVNWKSEDGGALHLYLKNGKTISVLPQAGTMVCFFSADFEHEVMPATRERASLAGWFRKRI